MKSCEILRLRPGFSLICVFLLVFACLLPLAIAYPAYAITPSSEPAMKGNTDQELPASVLKAVQKDLAKQTNLPEAVFKLAEATRETWSDGCLGLGLAEELCSQALVEGWRVTVARGKQTWVYRTDGTGRVIRSET